LSIARGSLSELDTQMQIAIRLGYSDPQPELGELTDGIFAKLTSLMNVLGNQEDSP
jgi:four helix bundle protein